MTHGCRGVYGRAMRSTLFSLLLVLVSACASTPDLPPHDSRPVTVEGDDGARTTYRVMQKRGAVRVAAPGGTFRFHYIEGIADDAGRVIVPLQLQHVKIISPYLATAMRLDGTTSVFVDLPSGRIRPTSYLHLQDNVYIDNHSPAERRADVVFADDRGQALATVRNIGGSTVDVPQHKSLIDVALRPLGKLWIVHLTTAEGDAVSQMFDRRGRPASPIVPRLVELPFIESEGRIHPNDYPSRAGSVLGGFVKTPLKARHGIEWAVPVGVLPDAKLPDPRLFLALDERGRALPLPAGAIAMTPLTWETRGVHSGWAIVYVTPAGRRYAVGQGLAGDVIAAAAALPRYRDIRNVRYSVRNDRDVGAQSPLMAWLPEEPASWELVLTDSLIPMVKARPGEVLATWNAFVVRWDAQRADEMAAFEAKIQAEKDRAEAQAAAAARAFAARLPEFLARNDWWAARNAAAMGGAKERALVLERFGALDEEELAAAERAGVEAGVVARARQKMEARLREAEARRRADETRRRADDEARLREGEARRRADEAKERDGGLSFVEGLRAFLDALAGFRGDSLPSGGGGDSVIDRVRRQTWENFERYNRGQQNWW